MLLLLQWGPIYALQVLVIEPHERLQNLCSARQVNEVESYTLKPEP